MPKVDLLEKPFLLPEQEEMLVPGKRLLTEIEFPADPDTSLMSYMQGVQAKFFDIGVGYRAYFANASKQLSPGLESLKDLETALRVQALSHMYFDWQFRLVKQLVAVGAGVAKADHSHEAADKLEGLGREAILRRARYASTVMLRANGYLTDTWGMSDKEETPWQLANSVYDKARAPVSFGNSEWDRFHEWSQAAYDLSASTTPSSPKMGRSKLMYALRTAVYVRKVTRDAKTDPEFVDAFGNFLQNTIYAQTPVLELNDETITAVMRTAYKVRRYFSHAAQSDPHIAEHPVVRYFAHAQQNLQGYDIKSEQAVFDRDVRAVALRETRATS